MTMTIPEIERDLREEFRSRGYDGQEIEEFIQIFYSGINPLLPILYTDEIRGENPKGES